MHITYFYSSIVSLDQTKWLDITFSIALSGSWKGKLIKIYFAWNKSSSDQVSLTVVANNNNNNNRSTWGFSWMLIIATATLWGRCDIISLRLQFNLFFIMKKTILCYTCRLSNVPLFVCRVLLSTRYELAKSTADITFLHSNWTSENPTQPSCKKRNQIEISLIVNWEYIIHWLKLIFRQYLNSDELFENRTVVFTLGRSLS